MAKPTISQFLDSLGVRLAVRRPSWDGTDESTDTVVMKLWFKDVEPGSDGRSIGVWKPRPPGDRSDPIGRAERLRSIAHLEAGRPTYAVLRYGKDRDDPLAKKYDGVHLRKLNGVDRRPNGDVFVTVDRLVTVDEYLSRAGARSSLEQDLADIGARHPNPDQATTRQALVQARMGQGRYRAGLLSLWGGACAVTGCSVGTLLIASHAMAWADSNDDQRLDPANGLPLIANLDRLFDNHLIAFEPDTGDMLVSDVLSKKDRALVGVPARLRKKPTKRQAVYLRHHLDLFIAAQEGTED
ncbi:HNH endonuclease [Burkholderia cepacia]|uniref:HNH endonuclease n=1 Tax=Burkholderia cepacia TaxID=292 RepID=UPI00158C4E95|nr:HNH endonuclease signature motif containing protein [Burkholderia cepacia]MCA8162021.1 HNH endonuclease [Burkholderia cepacia]